MNQIQEYLYIKNKTNIKTKIEFTNIDKSTTLSLMDRSDNPLKVYMDDYSLSEFDMYTDIPLYNIDFRLTAVSRDKFQFIYLNKLELVSIDNEEMNIKDCHIDIIEIETPPRRTDNFDLLFTVKIHEDDEVEFKQGEIKHDYNINK